LYDHIVISPQADSICSVSSPPASRCEALRAGGGQVESDEQENSKDLYPVQCVAYFTGAACPACPVAPEDGTGVGQHDRTGACPACP